MITMARVDDRLIHGQVAVKWSKELKISRIIVASDTIAKNAVQVAALKGAAPAGVKAAILPIEKAQGILSDPRSSDMRILVVSNDPADILAVLKGIEERPVVNVANYGRINGPIGGKQKISDSVYLTDEDKSVLKDIEALGDEVIHQPLPESDRVDLMTLI